MTIVYLVSLQGIGDDEDAYEPQCVQLTRAKADKWVADFMQDNDDEVEWVFEITPVDMDVEYSDRY